MFTRQNPKKLTLFWIILLTLILVGITSMDALAQVSLKPTGELRIGMPSLVNQTLHPHWAPSTRKFYYEVMFDFLVNLDEKMNLVEGVAHKWEEAPDHLSWTFYIRDGVKFHDGTPLTLEDVKYSLDTLLDKKTITGRSMQETYQKSVEIVRPNKIVIHLQKPWPVLLYYLSPGGQGGGVILPRKYIEEKGNDFDKHPIGTGPYMFLENKEGDYIKFVAQDHHWRVGTPKYRYLTFKLLPEEGTRAASLRRGEVDVIMVDRKRAKELAGDGFPIVKKKSATELNMNILRIYKTDNPLSNLKVRQALVYAVDKAAILKNILLGEGELIGHSHYMFKTSIGYKEFPPVPYDPEKAKRLLVEAGYPDGFTIYLYSFVTTVPEQKLIMESIASYWEAIGIKPKILEVESSTAGAVRMKKKEPPGPAVDVLAWTALAQASWRPLYHSDVDKFYFSQTADPVLDRLIDEFDNSPTLEEYIKSTRRCMERVYEMFYKMGIASVDILFATSKKVPQWECGKGNYDSYRFEYIGAQK